MNKNTDTDLQRFTDRVCDAYRAIENPRINALIQSLIKHLHHFVKENQLTESEWEYSWEFFARMAKCSTAERNEFLLAADVLGVSQLVEQINHPLHQGDVGFALVGPFFRANAPHRARGQSIASEDTLGIKVKITGKVFNAVTKMPIANALVDVWQAANNGFYENQDPAQVHMNLRGKFTTDEQGTYELLALMPTAYPVPTDGPVGELLALAQRNCLRPAHIHAIVSAHAHETLVTQIFVTGDEHMNNDVVFTANDTMMGDFIKVDDAYTLCYDFQLKSGESIYPEAPIK